MTPAARAVGHAAFGAILGFSLAAALFFRPFPAPPRDADAAGSPLPSPPAPRAEDGGEAAGIPASPGFRVRDYSHLPNWADGDPRPALQAFRRSCAVIAAKEPAAPIVKPGAGPLVRDVYGAARDWASPCADLAIAAFPDAAAARRWIEARFTPHEIVADVAAEGLFTGYYEPELLGSRTRSPDYPWPALKPPSDLVTVDLKDFDEDLPSARLRGRLAAAGGRLTPYPERGAIERGFAGAQDAVVWLKDRADLFFLHIQGSGRIRLPDGEVMRIGYAADNGRDYRSIGRELIRRGAFEPHEASLTRIKDWLRRASPEEAAALYAANPSFIFFEERRIEDPALGPIGAMGVSLTPEVSLAVDPAFHAYGPMAWFETHKPRPDGRGADPWTGLGVFQDTGSAIRGAGRVDMFFGWGAGAEMLAGRMKHQGRLWVLTPSRDDRARPIGAASARP